MNLLNSFRKTVTTVATVDSVLSAFAQTVEALNAIANHHTAQMDAHDRAIADLEAARAASDLEASKAQAAAGRIAALIAG